MIRLKQFLALTEDRLDVAAVLIGFAVGTAFDLALFLTGVTPIPGLVVGAVVALFLGVRLAIKGRLEASRRTSRAAMEAEKSQLEADNDLDRAQGLYELVSARAIDSKQRRAYLADLDREIELRAAGVTKAKSFSKILARLTERSRSLEWLEKSARPPLKDRLRNDRRNKHPSQNVRHKQPPEEVRQQLGSTKPISADEILEVEKQIDREGELLRDPVRRNEDR